MAQPTPAPIRALDTTPSISICAHLTQAVEAAWLWRVLARPRQRRGLGWGPGACPSGFEGGSWPQAPPALWGARRPLGESPITLVNHHRVSKWGVGSSEAGSGAILPHTTPVGSCGILMLRWHLPTQSFCPNTHRLDPQAPSRATIGRSISQQKHSDLPSSPSNALQQRLRLPFEDPSIPSAESSRSPGEESGRAG